MTEAQLRHLDLIQAVIARMAQNSFLLKGWSVTVVAALLGLGIKEGSWALALVGYIPLVTFWGLDAYYLRQERLFRGLYDTVRAASGTEFSMDTGELQVERQLAVVLSGTVAGIHGLLAITLAIASLVLKSGL